MTTWARLIEPPEVSVTASALGLPVDGEYTITQADLEHAAHRFEKMTGEHPTHVIWPGGTTEKIWSER